MVAFLLSFVMVLILEPRFIRYLKNRGLRGQPIRTDGPKDHLSKQGTPTMGGAVMVGTVLLTSLLLCDLTNQYVWFVLGVMCATGVVGFLDDWRKITQQTSKGITGKQKLAAQGGIALVFALLLYLTGFSTALTVPFIKDAGIILGVFFILLSIIVIVGSSNAVNLTDGLDGLAIGPIMTVSATYAVLAYVAGHSSIAQYLAVPHVPGAGDIAIILASLTASGLAFLWFNSFPAQVFMGDLGALGIGALLGASAVVVKQELILVLAGLVFVVEALSVIIQVYSFKLRGKRVFRMAPLHHHFELGGLSEPKIIVRFWIISIVLAILSLATLKLR